MVAGFDDEVTMSLRGLVCCALDGEKKERTEEVKVR